MAEKYAAVGHVVQVIGPVLDVQFEGGHLPAIFNAVRITSEGYNIPEPLDVIVEVQQHLGEGRVRAVAMEPTEGMVRGMKAYDTGAGITVPGGRAPLGRVMNVLGKPVDQLGPVVSDKHYPIHRPAPSLDQQSTPLEMVETGIKVGDRAENVTDSQRGNEARRRFRVRRRRGTHARRQRLVAGNVRGRRHRSGQLG